MLLIGNSGTGKTEKLNELLAAYPNRLNTVINPLALTRISDVELNSLDAIGIEEVHSVSQLRYCLDRLSDTNLFVVLTSSTFGNGNNSFYNDLPAKLQQQLKFEVLKYNPSFHSRKGS